MKKVFLSIAIIGALMVTSCKDKAKTDTTEEATTEAAAEETTTEAVAESSDGTPSFSDPDVQAYVDAYDSYIEEYAKAAESKDMTAFTELGTKGQELAGMAQDISGKMTGAEGEQLTTYMTERAKEIQELTKKFMQ